MDTAFRSHSKYPWTGPELELLARRDLSRTEIALRTGRTVYAVALARRRLQQEPRYQNLAGLSESRE